MTTQQPAPRSTAAPALLALFLGLAAAIFGAGWYLARRTALLAGSLSTEALVTVAMAAAVPVLYYLLVALPRRQGVIPLLAGFLVCTLLAKAVLPAGQETVLGYVEKALILTEGSLVVILALKIAKILRYLREEQAAGELYGFTRQFKAAVARALGNATVGELLASEVTNVYYSFFFWRIASEVPPGGRPFTSYREDYKILFIAVSCIGILELTGVHFLLAYKFSATTAWVVTALSAYGYLFLLADFVALVKRPSMLYRDQFYFQMGLRWSAVIPLNQVSRAEKLAYNLDTAGMMQCAVQKHSANVVVYFTEAHTVTGLFGMKKTGQALILNADDPAALIRALTPNGEILSVARPALAH